MATRLAFLFIFLSFTGCGKSPWSDYVKEKGLSPETAQKTEGQCDLLDANQIQWIQSPSVQGESIFQMTFLRPPDFNLKVEVFMPDMGHGSAPTRIEAADSTATSFIVKNIFLYMHGFWELRIQNADQILCRFRVDLNP